MSRVTRSLTTVLIFAAVVFAPIVLGRGVLAGQGAAPPASSSANDRARLVGTYELVMTEAKDPETGKWLPTPILNCSTRRWRPLRPR